jgi:hypothetical protein
MQLIELSAIPQHEMADILSYRKKHEKKNEVRTDIIEKPDLLQKRTTDVPQSSATRACVDDSCKKANAR